MPMIYPAAIMDALDKEVSLFDHKSPTKLLSETRRQLMWSSCDWWLRGVVTMRTQAAYFTVNYYHWRDKNHQVENLRNGLQTHEGIAINVFPQVPLHGQIVEQMLESNVTFRTL